MITTKEVQYIVIRALFDVRYLFAW